MDNTVAKQKCHVSHLNFKFTLSFLHFYMKYSIHAQRTFIKVLRLALFMKQNLKSGLVWAGWAD